MYQIKEYSQKDILYQEGEDAQDLTQVDKMILDEISSRGKQHHISYFGFHI